MKEKWLIISRLGHFKTVDFNAIPKAVTAVLHRKTPTEGQNGRKRATYSSKKVAYKKILYMHFSKS